MVAAPAKTDGIRSELRKPYVAKPSDASLATLAPMLGKYPQDGTDFLRKGVLADRLKLMMGNRFDMLVKNMGTVGPLTKEGEVWSLVGNRPHAGGSDAGAIVIDPARNGVRVWLFGRGAQSAFTDLAEGNIPWTESVQKTIDNAQPPAR